MTKGITTAIFMLIVTLNIVATYLAGATEKNSFITTSALQVTDETA